MRFDMRQLLTLQQIFGSIPECNWIDIPPANSLRPGTRRRVKDIGPDGTELVTNGTNWVKDGGSEILIASATGDLTTPLATISNTSGAAVQFAIPGGNPSIPANLLRIGSYVRMKARLRRHNANGSAVRSYRIGNSGVANIDLPINGNGASMAATDLLDYREDWVAHITGATSFSNGGWGGINNQMTNAFVDRSSANLDIQQPLYFSIDINPISALDSFDLLSYEFFVKI